MEIEQEVLGFSSEGEVIIDYTISNSCGVKIKLSNIGAAVTSIELPINESETRNILLGYASYNEYVNDSLCIGKCVGRYAGRIAKGKFSIDENIYKLTSNEGTTHFNGGVNSFDKKIWSARTEDDMIVFSYVSAAQEEGYPAEFGLEIGYTLSDDNELGITVVGEADSDTIVNVAPYLYLNLNGVGESGSDMQLKINSSEYVPLTSKLLPKGGVASVENTPMDFSNYKLVSKDSDSDFENLPSSDGYDNYWLVSNWKKGTMSSICSLRSASGDVELNITSTQPALYFSSCGTIEDCGVNVIGEDFKNGDAVILSPQNISDFSDDDCFVSPVLRVGEVYQHHTSYKFKF